MIFEIEIKMLNSLKIYYLKRISSIKESNSLKNYYLKRISKIEELIEKLSSDCEGNNILQYDYDEDGVVSIIDITIIVMAIIGKLDNDERYDAENLTFNGKPLDLNNDGNLDVIDIQTLVHLRNEEIEKLDAVTSSYDSPGFSVKDYIENYYNTNGDFPTLEQVKETYNNYVSAPEEIIIDEITYHKTQPENPGEGYELVTTEQNGVTYYAWIEPSNIINGHEYVDLGLPSGTLWATMNVGANSITDYGNYYKYGLGASQYDNAQADYTGTESPLAANADTAVQVWGGQWHMPTKAQFEELTANTTYSVDTIGTTHCYKFTAQNGNYILFPAAGLWSNGRQEGVNNYGFYWSSSSYVSDASYVLGLVYGHDSAVAPNSRKEGYPVRPVIG